MNKLIIYNIKTIYTPCQEAPIRGKDLAKIKTYHNAYIVICEGVIANISEGSYIDYLTNNPGEYHLIDAHAMIVLPGFIDAHSHLVHASSREDEFSLLRKGYSYLDILAQGGGILNTVKKTKEASFASLYAQAKSSLDKMLSYGVVALETKSGYGLDLETEVKQLKVAYELKQNHPLSLSITYMGAHAIPLKYKEYPQLYIDEVLKDLEYIASLSFVTAVDVFCEEGVFNLAQTKRILEHAKKLGFKIKLHADEMTSLGGAGLGVSLGAISADHLIAISDEDIIKLGQSNTFANLLPGTSFFLRKPYARAREMLDANVALCISGDYNPGSCPTENFQLIMQIATNYLFLSPEEVLNAVTKNPAYLLGLNNLGELSPGKDGTLLLVDSPNLAYMMYHFGINHVQDVYIKGKLVVKNKVVLGDNV